MRKSLTGILVAAALSVSLAAVTVIQAQTTTITKVQAVQNPDGTYTIVEYPVGKETVVTLNPIGIAGATGTATILRDANGASIKVNLTSLPADMAVLNLYAVDPTGAITALGPVDVANSVGTFTTTTPLTSFMLVASPDANLTAYDANTKIFFRSAVPTGLALIPMGQGVAAVGTPVAAVATVATVATEVSDYAVPMLGISGFKAGDENKLKINFTGAAEGARANVFIEPHKNGKMTAVRMRFHDLKEAPKGLAYVLWAVSPDNQFQRLGAIVNVRGRNEAEIKSETEFADFGLLLTTEEAAATTGTIIKPAGHRVGVIQIIR
ncbi:MAG TPA: hypothetical protein VKD91_18005 [Pyrinomonadaceae bacterium]|nr:hypothetical protein [Pyrinomonadaceae bacterium]